MFLATDIQNLAFGVHQSKRVHILNERFKGHAPAVRVSGHGSANAQPVCPGLFLYDAPYRIGALLRVQKVLNQFRPLDSCFDAYNAALAVQVDDIVHFRHTDMDGPFTELLTAHCMTRTGYADGFPLCFRLFDDLYDLIC